MKATKIISWALRISIAVIFLQTLYFKFTAHPDSVHIFSNLGIEPFGRIGVGIIELITSIILLINRTKIIGMILSLGVIIGAVFSHFLVLGTEVKGDGGSLFILAIIVFIANLILLFLHKTELNEQLSKILKK